MTAPMTHRATLDARLMDAHARADKTALAGLYAEAASIAGDIDQRAFFLTHAYVWALDAGLEDAARLRSELVAMGRETA